MAAPGMSKWGTPSRFGGPLGSGRNLSPEVWVEGSAEMGMVLSCSYVPGIFVRGLVEKVLRTNGHSLNIWFGVCREGRNTCPLSPVNFGLILCL